MNYEEIVEVMKNLSFLFVLFAGCLLSTELSAQSCWGDTRQAQMPLIAHRDGHLAARMALAVQLRRLAIAMLLRAQLTILVLEW